MNLSNKLTVLRIFLVPIFILFLETEKIPNNFLFALIVFIIAALTDLFDGKIARKRHQITDFGKFLDPLADKILTLSAFMCFIEMNLISAIPVIIIMAREFAVTSVRLVAATQNEVIAANNLGKVKTVIQIFSIGIIIFLIGMLKAPSKTYPINLSFKFFSSVSLQLQKITVAIYP